MTVRFPAVSVGQLTPVLSLLGGGIRGQVAVKDPGEEPNRPAADPQVDVGVAETHITGLVEGGLVVVGQPGQAGHSPVVVVLLHGEGHGSLDQPLDPRAGRDRWGVKA
jgi:hypothetical protein